MRVVLDTSLFDSSQVVHTQLIELVNRGMTLRHRILVQDDRALAFQSWMQKLSPDEMRWEIETILDDSLTLEANNPCRGEVHVADLDTSDWAAAPPRLSIRDSLRVLREPFSMIVEDEQYDRAFLLSMATPEQRSYLELLEKEAELDFVHGGGIPNIRRPIKAHKTRPSVRISGCVLFDSDALRPGQPSVPSSAIRDLCAEPPIVTAHQLRRRTIENYLPESALRKHILSRPPRKRTHERELKAFIRMDKPQRHHFNLERGFAGDEARIRTSDSPGDLYHDLSDDDRSTLQAGFGANIKKLFDKMDIREHWLREDGGWHEVNPIVTEIIAML